jgi:bifunctional non-homologous end joining protein LigD
MLGLDVALPIPIKPAPCCTECVQSRPPASFSLACRRVPICPQVRQDVVQPQWTFPEFGSCIIVRRRRSIRWVSRASVKPTGVTWVYEIKHDGFRMMVRRDAAGVRLLTRNGIDWTTHFAFIAEAAAAFRVKYFLIDGEAVCCDGDGMPVFDRLRYRRDDRHVFLYAFDVLQLDSQERLEPIEDRKAELAKLLRPAKPGLQLNEHMRAGRHRVSPRLQARVGRHRVQAGRLACPAARTIGSNARSRMRQW